MRRLTKRWIEVRCQPLCNPWWLTTALKTPKQLTHLPRSHYFPSPTNPICLYQPRPSCHSHLTSGRMAVWTILCLRLAGRSACDFFPSKVAQYYSSARIHHRFPELWIVALWLRSCLCDARAGIALLVAAGSAAELQKHARGQCPQGLHGDRKWCDHVMRRSVWDSVYNGRTTGIKKF